MKIYHKDYVIPWTSPPTGQPYWLSVKSSYSIVFLSFENLKLLIRVSQKSSFFSWVTEIWLISPWLFFYHFTHQWPNCPEASDPETHIRIASHRTTYKSIPFPFISPLSLLAWSGRKDCQMCSLPSLSMLLHNSAAKQSTFYEPS